MLVRNWAEEPMDFLIYMEVLTNQIESPEVLATLYQLEAERARHLVAQGILQRLWRVPGRRANWGIWSAASPDELHAALSSLPLYPYLDITVHPLAKHPNDPLPPS